MRKKFLLFLLCITVVSVLLLSACISATYNQKPYNTDNGDDSNIIANDNDDNNTDDNNTDDEIIITVEENKLVLALGNLNIRSAPEINDNNIIGLLEKNTTVEYIGSYNSGWNVINYKGNKAYVSASSKFSKIIDKSAAKENNIIESVIDAGMAVLGTPYEYGSVRILNWAGKVNPDFTGDTFDCSAFVQYAYYIGGQIKLQGDSRSMSRNGYEVSIGNIERGDVIFMTSDARQNNSGIEKIGHVAIYLGDNKILHTYGTGGVKITNFEPFWKNRFIMARRMV